MPSLHHEPELIRSFDGTIIAARRMGEGTPLLIANAIGSNLASWRAALAPLAAERDVFAWDLRGTLESLPPATERIDPGAHAEDAMAVLEHYGVQEFDLAAWSTGARTAMEIAHRYPERVRSLVLVCGGYGYSMGRVLRYLEIPSVLPFVAGISKYFAGPVESALRAFVARPELAGLIRQSGMLAGTADIRAVVDVLHGLSECDLRMVLAIYQEVVGDSAAELLPDIEARTLLIAGERDQFTSRRMMEEMERLIPDARLEVYERATHFLPLEYPTRLSDDLLSATSSGGRSRAAPR